MRARAATALVVAAVGAVVVAALVDAVRPGDEPALDARAAVQLERLGGAGTLVYTDRACELHALSLPGLTPAAVPESPELGCRISVSPDGRKVAPGGARWSPDGSQYAICRGTRVDVVAADGGPAVGSFDGCAPAWRPDGMLLFARGGRILQARGERVVVPQRELERAALAHPNAPAVGGVDELRVLDLAWSANRPGQGSVVALIEARYTAGLPDAQTTVAWFAGGRLVLRNAYFRPFESLAVSPADEIVPEPIDRNPFVQRYRITPTGRIEWSPDGRLTAVATRASVVVIDETSGRQARIPLTVRDLAWR